MVNASLCELDAWFRLGFQSIAELQLSQWLAQSELYQFADDALKRLARATGTFVTYDASTIVTSLQSVYLLPAGHVFTESAWLQFGGHLRITPVSELFALDQAWSIAAGASTRISFDAAGAERAVLYPVPNAGGTLCQVMALVPPTVSGSSASIPISPATQDYFTYAMLAGARGKESDSAMPEVAEHIRERMRAYEAIFTQLWGGGR